MGLHGQGFTRLVKMMDHVAGKINDPVIIQRGHTNYMPQNASSFSFKDNRDIEELYRSADIVVTHGGVGSIMDALVHGKPVIVVPRLSKLGEHKNDHQLDIATTFSKLGFILAVYNETELDTAIHAIKSGTVRLRSYDFGPERKRLTAHIDLYLRNLQSTKYQ